VSEPESTPPPSISAEPAGIAGWLILPAILLVLMILAGGLQVTMFPAIAEAATGLVAWKRYLLSLQVLLNALLAILCPAILLVMFFRRMNRFPRLFVLWAAVYLVVAVAHHFAVILVFGEKHGMSWSDQLSVGALRLLLLSMIPVAIFIPYLLKSRRVRNTFVN
jgi:hypothetical protein